MNVKLESPDILLFSDYLNEILLCIDMCTPLLEEDDSYNFRTRYPEIFEVFFRSLATKIIINTASLFSDSATTTKRGKKLDNLSLKNYWSKNQQKLSPKTRQIYSDIEAQLKEMNLAEYRNKLVAHKSKIEAILESPYSQHEGHSFNRSISINSLRQLALLGIDFFNSAFRDLTCGLSGNKYPDSYNFIDYQNLSTPYSMEDFLFEFKSSTFI